MIEFYRAKLAECHKLATEALNNDEKYEHHLSDAKLYEDAIKRMEAE